ncbi:siderophore-interacting protein [Patulibacter sp. SYSU D01012]|uniref:siderophore-interacting protein n=1 Tax=Patulibacter sp. SYSU D01012 TaxID=2817381 RepID=UPI001B316CF8|nr:siderophore-interacting protein [Patulibacter sp. SYSU D01012]
MADAPAPSRRPVRRPIRTQVEEVVRLTPHMVRVVLGGPELERFVAGEFTDHYVKLLFPPAEAPYGMDADMTAVRDEHPRALWPRTRTYTVRAWDPDARRLTLDVVTHGDVGLAGAWAARAAPGDVLQLLGPGGAYAPDPAADWHLMVGDACVLPAIAASLARVPDGALVHAIVAVDGPEDEQPLETPGDLRLTWLHVDVTTQEGEDRLVAAVRDLAFPDGEMQGFVHGEATAVRAIRRHLLADRGVPRERLSISGYWRRTLDEDGWQSSKGDWNRQVEADVPQAA